jgi:hypothetical protein
MEQELWWNLDPSYWADEEAEATEEDIQDWS